MRTSRLIGGRAALDRLAGRGAAEPSSGRLGISHRSRVSVLNGGVRLVRSLLGVVALSVFLAVALAGAPTGAATAAGGCHCTVAQMQSPTGNSYTIPYDGVIVSSGTYVGNSVEAGDTVRVQTVHKTGATTGTVVSEGTAHGLLSLPTGA